MGDCVKPRQRNTIRQHVGLERNTGIEVEVSSTKAYVIPDGTSCLILNTC
jgi:hypothetical protein